MRSRSNWTRNDTKILKSGQRLRRVSQPQNFAGIPCALLPGTISSLMALNGRMGLAQSVNASVAGKIADPSGGLVADASVMLTNLGTGFQLTTQTNSMVRYAFPAVPPGAMHSLRITKRGYQDYELMQLQVIARQAASENAVLKLESATEEVTVAASGQAQLFESGSNDLGNVIAPQAVEQLPLNGRNFLQLALLSGKVAPVSNMDEQSGSL